MVFWNYGIVHAMPPPGLHPELGGNIVNHSRVPTLSPMSPQTRASKTAALIPFR